MVEAPNTPTPRALGQSDAHPDRSGNADGPLVLVVDDDALNRTVLRAMIHKLGYRSHIAVNGLQAVEAAQHQGYAAILMDCLMPEMDGYDATRAIRRAERTQQAHGIHDHVPVIAVTAVAINGAREQCIAAGMDDYLSKPVIARDLAVILERWLRKSPARASWAPEIAEDDANPGDPLVDPDILASLRELGGDDADAFVAGIVDDFIADVTARLQAVRAAILREDRPALVHALHSVAGCAAMVGATQVEGVARSLSIDDLIAEPQLARERMDHLEEIFTRTCRHLESLTRA